MINWPMRRKITLIFSVLILAIFSISILSIYTSSSINNNSETVQTEVIPSIDLVNSIETSVHKHVATTYKLMLSPDAKNISSNKNDLIKLEAIVNSNFSKYEKSKLTDEQLTTLESIRTAWEAFLQTSSKAIQFHTRGEVTETLNKQAEMNIHIDEISTLLNDLILFEDKKVAASIELGEKRYMNGFYFSVGVFIFATIIAILGGYFLIHYVQKPIVKISSNFRKMAEGDLTIQPMDVNSTDELGQLSKSFNEMLFTLQSVVKNMEENIVIMADTATSLSTSSEETSKALSSVTVNVMEVANGTNSQLASTTTSMEAFNEISHGMNEAEKAITKVNDVALITSKSTYTGRQAIEDTVISMRSIQSSANETALIVEKLAEQSNQIQQIVSLITAISDQTNLLSLNAAIEAARAGEHGKGFAVVADEVRKLAVQSNHAAQNIDALIDTIRIDIDKANASMKNSLDNVERGISIAEVTERSFEEITSHVADVSKQAQEISAVIEQINSTTYHVQQMIEEVAAVATENNERTQTLAASTQQQNATMQEIAASTQVLSNMAENLQTIVSKFKL